MDTILGGFNFTFAYLDDIVISCKTKRLHREHRNKVFAQIWEFGFKVKEAKCDFCMNKIKYLGHIIDKDGRRPDPERATAIKDMPALDKFTTFQSFLGLANYYQSFIKNLHDLRASLNELLKKYRYNTPLAVSPAETMFARKIRSVFDKLLPKQNKLRKPTLAPKKRFNPGEKNYLKKYQNNTSCWERGIIKKRISDMVYIV